MEAKMKNICNVRIDENVYKKAKAHIRKTGQTISGLVNLAVENHIKKEKIK